MPHSPHSRKKRKAETLNSSLVSPTALINAWLMIAKVEAGKKRKAAVGKKKGSVSVKRLKKMVESEVIEVDSDSKDKRMKNISWAKESMHPYTDHLLTLIEENPTWKVAFGFDKGVKGAVKTGGKKICEHQQAIAQTLLIDDSSGQWAGGDVVRLGDVVKNRINVLKKSFQECPAMLTDTGMGLIDEDHEDEIIPGSTLDNLWDKIKKHFPWYKRMNHLMQSSPLVNRSAVMHSHISLDLSALGIGIHRASSEGGEVEAKSEEVDDGERREMGNVFDERCREHSANSCAGSPGLDSLRSVSPLVNKTVPQSKSVTLPPVLPAPKPMATAHGPQKCQQMAIDKAEEMVTAARKSHLKLTEDSFQSHTEHEHIKQQMALKIEQLWLQAEERQQQADHDHEMHMLAWKLEFQWEMCQCCLGSVSGVSSAVSSDSTPTSFLEELPFIGD
ncbi:hypothetical protein K439DRAFT_1624526, partial [Ramaria rubella]